MQNETRRSGTTGLHACQKCLSLVKILSRSRFTSTSAQEHCQQTHIRLTCTILPRTPHLHVLIQIRDISSICGILSVDEAYSQAICLCQHVKQKGSLEMMCLYVLAACQGNNKIITTKTTKNNTTNNRIII